MYQIVVKKKAHKVLILIGLKSTPDKIRTCNRLIRSQVLYPVELRVQGNNEYRTPNVES